MFHAAKVLSAAALAAGSADALLSTRKRRSRVARNQSKGYMNQLTDYTQAKPWHAAGIAAGISAGIDVGQAGVRSLSGWHDNGSLVKNSNILSAGKYVTDYAGLTSSDPTPPKPSKKTKAEEEAEELADLLTQACENEFGYQEPKKLTADTDAERTCKEKAKFGQDGFAQGDRASLEKTIAMKEIHNKIREYNEMSKQNDNEKVAAQDFLGCNNLHGTATPEIDCSGEITLLRQKEIRLTHAAERAANEFLCDELLTELGPVVQTNAKQKFECQTSAHETGLKLAELRAVKKAYPDVRFKRHSGTIVKHTVAAKADCTAEVILKQYARDMFPANGNKFAYKKSKTPKSAREEADAPTLNQLKLIATDYCEEKTT